MTADIKVLDLTVNKWVKYIMMKKLNKWFAEKRKEQREKSAGKSLDEISIKFKLTIINPLYALWMIDAYNQLSSFESKKIILTGWKASGISDALTKRFSGGFIDLFYDMDPFDQGEVSFSITSVVNCVSEECVEKERVFAATMEI